MDISSFEAVAMYDYGTVRESSELSFPLHSVVYDLDHYAAGLCTCSEAGEVHLLGSCETGEGHTYLDDFLTGLRKSLPGILEGEFQQIVESWPEEMERKLRRFLRSEGQLDEMALKLGGTALSCSELKSALGAAEERVKTLLTASLELLEKNEVDEDAVRVILVGRGGENCLLTHLIRAEWSFDPFLSDPRFVNETYPDSPSRIAAAEESIRKQRAAFGQEITLHLFDREGEQSLVPLATRETPAAALDAAHYLGPIFVAEGEPLRLETDGKIWEAVLPYSISPLDSDLIEAAVVRKGGETVLRIRRCIDPARVYDLPMA